MMPTTMSNSSSVKPDRRRIGTGSTPPCPPFTPHTPLQAPPSQGGDVRGGQFPGASRRNQISTNRPLAVAGEAQLLTTPASPSSEIIGIDDLAVGAIGKPPEDGWLDRGLEEPDRAVAEGEVAAAGMPAAVTAHEG